MNNRMQYFQQEDTLYWLIADGQEAGSVELSPNITAELNDEGELLGIEILEAGSFLRNFFLDAAQAKLLNLSVPAAQKT